MRAYPEADTSSGYDRIQERRGSASMHPPCGSSGRGPSDFRVDCACLPRPVLELRRVLRQAPEETIR
jgi:hypothetical protein